MNIENTLKYGISILKEHNILNPYLDCKILLSESINKDIKHILINSKEILNTKQIKNFNKFIKSKISKRINSEMDGCIIQNLNFINMVEMEQYVFKRNIEQSIMNRIYEIKEQTEKYDKIKKAGDNFTPKETDDLFRTRQPINLMLTNNTN